MNENGGKYYPVPVGDDQSADDQRTGDPRAAVRASNDDREQAHAFLSAAMSVGVLDFEEYTDRASNAMAAVTLADLDALCRDLPMERLVGAVADSQLDYTRVSTSGASPVVRTTAIASTTGIRGGAVVGSELKATSFFGGVEIDLREVEFTAPVLTIACKAILGGIKIIVPSDVTVEVHGSGVIGSFSGDAAGPGRPGSPRVVVRGVAFVGGVSVERVARGQQNGPRRPN